MMMKLILCDPNKELCYEWERFFSSEKTNQVEIRNCRFQELPAFDCVVSPANSFGLMDGGVDAQITDFFGIQIMSHVQDYILKNYYGEQPIGTSFIIKTGKEKHPYLAHTPTMTVPMDISKTFNVYYAMRAMLMKVLQYPEIKSVACPGLGTLTGRVPFTVAAKQMFLGYLSIYDPPIHISWDKALTRVNALIARQHYFNQP